MLGNTIEVRDADLNLLRTIALVDGVLCVQSVVEMDSANVYVATSDGVKMLDKQTGLKFTRTFFNSNFTQLQFIMKLLIAD